MQWKMHDNSIFANLLRTPWWVSALLAVFTIAGFRLLAPIEYAVGGALPIIGIALVAAWRQLRAPSAKKVAARLDALRAMSWEEFARVLEAGYRREGYDVKRIDGAADFELTKNGRVSLVCARRWKAAVTGVEPLKELVAAGEKRGAGECVYICAGELSDKAKVFAAEKKVGRVEGVELTRLAT